MHGKPCKLFFRQFDLNILRCGLAVESPDDIRAETGDGIGLAISEVNHGRYGRAAGKSCIGGRIGNV